MRELLARVLDWFRRDTLDRELAEELRHHRQLLERDLTAAGTGANEATVAARYAAQRRLGNVTAVVEAARDRWSIPWLDHVQHDVRYAWRGLRRSPAFTLTVVFTLALGFGANAAIFSLLDRLFVQAPGAVADPDAIRRVYVLRESDKGEQLAGDEFNYPEWLDLKSGMGTVAATTYLSDSARVVEGSSARHVTVAYTDASYWSLLGVHAARGRIYAADEARIETPSNVVIISDGYWRRQLGARDDVIGQLLDVNGKQRIVIGVAPPNFSGVDLDANDLWMPLGAMPMAQFGPNRMWYSIRSDRRLRVLVHAPPGASPAPFEAQLTSVFRAGSVAAGYEEDSSAVVATGSLIAARGPMRAGPELLISTRLAWVSLLVLIIACANVANLLLTRLVERRREIAVRLALGVSRGRLATQLVAETLMLSAMSAVAALALGAWTGGALRATLMPDTRWRGAVIEPRLVVALFVMSVIAAGGIALVSIVHVNRFAGTDALKSGSRSTSHAGQRVRSALVIGQTALAVVLLTGAGLCVESLRRVLAVDVGYDLNRVAYAVPQMLGARGGEDRERRVELGDGLREAARRLSTTTGVEAVALASHGPMAGYYSTIVKVRSADSTPRLDGRDPAVRDVSPEYWRAVGLRTVRGRSFAERDGEGAPLVVVVNETMARTAWPGRDPIGECVMLYGGAICRTVVGVVRDARVFHVVEAPRMQLYVPLAQANAAGRPRRPAAIVVRARPGQLPVVVTAMRRTLDETLPNADLGLRDMHEALAPQFRPWRLGAGLFGALGALGLMVSAIGLYGMIAFGVRKRTHELGIRLALGAQRERIVLMVMQQGVRTVVAGLAIGMVLAMALSRFVASILYDTSLRDPRILAGVSVVMLASALLASLVPARRAAGVDPNVALRGD